MPDANTKSNAAPFDVAVVGAGVVGCAVVRRLTLAGARVVLVEKAPDILAGASKANSALLHTGFDAPEGSLELACMQAGYAEYLAIRAGLGLPLLETGALVVAWSEEERARLPEIVGQAHRNGVPDVSLLSRDEVLSREPRLSPALHGAVLVPGEHVVDPWSAPLAYVTQALANGAVVRRGADVRAGVFAGGLWSLDTSAGSLQARFVVNCAGLYGDRLEAALLGEAHFEIRPRKGQFVVLDKAAAGEFRSILLPVPSPRTKGIVVARTIFGNVLVGPTAEEQEARDVAAVDEATLEALLRHARTVLPGLDGMPVTALYAGLRPASEEKGYRVRLDAARNWLTLGGIRSTGLTAALGLGQFALARLREIGFEGVPIEAPCGAAVPNLAEHLPRDWQVPGYGEIVCHCEFVTSREIAAAFASPLPPGDIGGLKRRTRAGMGRCQGFHCGAHLAALSVGRLAVPLTVEAVDA